MTPGLAHLDSTCPSRSPALASRGPAPALICPRCERRTLAISDSESYDVPAKRGNVQTIQTYRCDPCGVNVRFVRVCIGEVSKATTRGRGNGGAAPRYVTVQEDALVVVRLG